jgi:acyl-CoA thioesterase FadM
VHYRSPATLRDRLTAMIWVSQLGRRSFVFEYSITDEVTGRLIAEECSTLVWHDYAAEPSRQIPPLIAKRMLGANDD